MIGSLEMHGKFPVIAMEISEQNHSVVSVPFELNESAYSTTSKIAATSTVDFDLLNANAVDGAPLKGWQCHCWNSTNGLEVSTCVYSTLDIFILS